MEEPLRYATIFSFFLASSAHLWSDSSYDEKISALEAEIDALSQANVHGTLGAKNPSTRGIPEKDGFFFTADYLYWRAEEDGLEYAVAAVGDPAEVLTLNNSQLVDVDFDWTSAFRVGAAYRFPHDRWDLGLNWTHYQNSCDSSANTHANKFLIVVWLPIDFPYAPDGNFASSASADWRLKYNVLDFGLQKGFFITKNLSLSPSLGIRGAWINQEMSIVYNFAFPDTTVFPSRLVDLENDYRGIGVNAGFNLLWHFDTHWSFFGRASSSLLYGRFTVSSAINGAGGEPLIPSVLFGEGNHSTKVKANLEAAAGFRWASFFVDRKYQLSFSASYELVEWFNQNQLRRFYTGFVSVQDEFTPRSGDLSLHGLTVSGQWDF